MVKELPDDVSPAHQTENPGWIRKNYGKAIFVGGVGVASGLANVEHGFLAVIKAGLKQAGYSTISAIFLLKLYNFLAERVKTIPGELIPIMVPILVTITANLTVHTLKGTEEPLLSTLPTMVTAPVGFTVLHIYKRVKQVMQLGKDLETMEIKL